MSEKTFGGITTRLEATMSEIAEILVPEFEKLALAMDKLYILQQRARLAAALGFLPEQWAKAIAKACPEFILRRLDRGP